MPTSIAAPSAASDAMAHGSLASLIHNAAQSADSPISADALSTKESASYIRSLSNFSLSDLRAQPQQLQSKSEALHQQLSELCISQTDAFIHIQQAEQEFSPFLDSLSTHLDDLITQTLPDLQKAADVFEAASKPVLAERERLQNVTDQYERGHLSDLLEIPTLIHTCVKAGQHSDAIQLAEHLVGLLNSLGDAHVAHDDLGASVHTSGLNHGQRSTYFSLLIEALSHLSTMKNDLVSSFSSPGLKLPAARRSVSILRKLNTFESQLSQIADRHVVLASAQSNLLAVSLGMSENQLCLAFLKARIRSFYSALDAMGSPSSFSSEAYLRRYIDLWREEMADTLGMAFPLFIDESSSSSQARSSDTSQPDMVTPAHLLSSFATSGLVRLRDTVSVQLQVAARKTDPSSSASSSLETLAETLANIHTQLSYASVSLTRFGFDFGKLLFAPALSAGAEETTTALSSIEAIWLDVLSRSLDQTFASLHGQLDQHMQSNETSLPSRWFTSSKLPRSALEDLYSVSADNAEMSAYDDFSRPNIELVDYPLFAKLLNQLMDWINALQVFAPVSLASILSQTLDRHLASITQRLLTQTPKSIAKLDRNVPYADLLLADQDAQSLLLHLDDEPVVRQGLQKQLIQDRESAILGKVLGMWHSSVVSWTLQVVQSQVFDLSDGTGAREADSAWNQAQEWISSTRSNILQSSKQRRLDATRRQKAHDDAVEAARVEAEEQVRREAEEAARKKAEEEARQQAEAESKRKAEEEAKRKAEEEAERKKKAEDEAKKKAADEAKRKAEEQANKKAEQEAKRKAEEEARKEADAEAKRKAEEEEEQARLKAEEEKKKKDEAEAARLKAEEEERLKAEAEAQEALARKKTEENAAEAKAEQEAREAASKKKAKEEAAAAKAEAEAQQAARKQAEEEAARAKAENDDQEAASKKQAEEAAAAKAAKTKADELARSEAAGKQAQEAAKTVADQPAAADASKHTEQEPGAVPSEAAAPQAVAQTQAETQVAAEPQGAPSMQIPASAPEQRSSSPAPKKFSLADKLRQRKEERDRAAAAAAKAAEPEDTASAADPAVEPKQAQSDSKTGAEAEASKQGVQKEASASLSEGTKAESSKEGVEEPSVSQPDAVETVKAEAVGEEAADEGEADEEDDKAADGEESGGNTPATPTTPNPADGNGGGSSKKKKKNKKKKK
ncbi:Conserved oligomeric Golgi complex subunit 8 [Kalmanozyma brasiliensis GHG001]|uniref:Conserved oligomeric Golgi complex subunit 8 n=1 Tax=Kalmanozyma brasiliensis (strain GHG001) TaxID=1365824 RepID=V5ESU8_KALBG|nr:Conserved oligomeric Golgi complex subunit 8 [Kalmanozyma brasiliensis GHG001]EST05019.1 Conserved oligomeric Golgi complex subunit 8 [Kalmanozyma brasiliensis GHG001]